MTTATWKCMPYLIIISNISDLNLLRKWPTQCDHCVVKFTNKKDWKYFQSYAAGKTIMNRIPWAKLSKAEPMTQTWQVFPRAIPPAAKKHIFYAKNLLTFYSKGHHPLVLQSQMLHYHPAYRKHQTESPLGRQVSKAARVKWVLQLVMSPSWLFGEQS